MSDSRVRDDREDRRGRDDRRVRDDRRGRKHRRNDRPGRNDRRKDDRAVTMRFSGIPSSARGLLIGKGGAVRKDFVTKGGLYHYSINADSDNPDTSTIEIVGTAFHVLKAQSKVLSRVAWAVKVSTDSQIVWTMPRAFLFKMTVVQDKVSQDADVYRPTSPTYRPTSPTFVPQSVVEVPGTWENWAGEPESDKDEDDRPRSPVGPPPVRKTTK